MRQWLALALATAAVPLAAQSWEFDCRGTVRSDSVFEAGAASERERRWIIVASDTAGYVKRDPEIAAGCVQPTVEVCGCELGADLIRCRSLGMTPAGEEAGMDFSIDRRSGAMRLSGRRYDPRSGKVVETTGLLACRVSEKR